jgi:hypothetical protein
MKRIKTQLTFGSLVVFLALVAPGCHKHNNDNSNNSNNNNNNPNNGQNGKYSFGWTGKDDPSKTPKGINVHQFSAAGPLPSQVDLTPYLPPIGDQGSTLTCVGWATAYYTKSASEAIAFNYNQSQLSSPAYQLSPKYLFLSIPDANKGDQNSLCNGTDFTPALEALLKNGVATMAAVPFDLTQGCSIGLLQSDWNADAAKHLIQYYRSVDLSVDGIKAQLANNNPVIIGIQVSYEFVNYRGGGGVLTGTPTMLNPAEYHALTIVGYDDTRGTGAFKIVNSWTAGWGEGGFIWIDYNTLVNNYIFNRNAYYIVSGGSPNNNNPPTPPPTPNPTPNTVDLAAWVFSDVSTYAITGNPASRMIYLNIYNVGQTSVPPSNWQFYYMYYNAFNANDYGIIFHDAFNTTVAPGTFSCPSADACNFNYTIPSGSSFTQVAFGQSSINRGYFVPPLNGYYYLVLIVDPNNSLNDPNRQNNIFYTTGQAPKVFQGGYSTNFGPGPEEGSDSAGRKFQPSLQALKLPLHRSAVGEKNLNAYTPEEIMQFVKQKYASGEISGKIKENSLNAKPSSKPYR